MEIYQYNRIRSLETELYMYRNLVYDSLTDEWRKKKGLFNKWNWKADFT